MVGASKILTVSYGTFSCTLEGFDDPFSTMKAIAEYFRELAADDRYFGAEPPTPDAAMLHRIAEREIQRRVEASVSAKGVVLRAERRAEAAEAAPAATPRPAMDLATVLAARARSAAAPAAATPAAASDAAVGDGDSIAAKLDRIRAVVTASQSAAESAFEDDDQMGDLAMSDTVSTDFGFDVDLGMTPDVVEDVEEAAAETSEKVAEEDHQPLAAEAEITEEHHEPLAAEAAEEIAEEVHEPLAAEAEITDELREPLAAEAVDEIAEEEPADVPEPAETVAQPNARVIKIQRSAAASPAAESAAPDVTSEPAAEAEDAAEPSRTAIFAALADDIESDTGEEDEPQNEEFETAAEDDDEALLAGIGAAIGGSGPDTGEDEALLREMAALAREVRRDAHEGRAILESSSRDDDASVERLMEEAKSKLEGDENRRRFSAISHLKAAVAATVADRQMKSHGTPEGITGDDDTHLDQYRDDLSKAVRPRRPDPETATTTPRPTMVQSSAPLVLVSEQRVDRPVGESGASAVRPRRIDAATFMRDDEDEAEPAGLGDKDGLVSPHEAKSFADFAERLGATSLPELLEAAAAYTATVEGQPHFSRPQILRKVANVSEDTDYSREDGLRSFGMLLREGKIQKISRGQFMITDASKFLSEDRTASR